MSQKAFMLGFIEGIKESLAMGSQIYDKFPELIKKRLNEVEFDQDATGIPDQVIQEFAFAFSRVPPSLRKFIVDRVDALEDFVYGDSYKAISVNELVLLANILAFYQKLGGSSRRALESAIDDAINGDSGYIVMKYDKRNSEVIRRPQIFGGEQWTGWSSN